MVATTIDAPCELVGNRAVHSERAEGAPVSGAELPVPIAVAATIDAPRGRVGIAVHAEPAEGIARVWG